ncbi:DsrE family protein [Thiomicrorhabdus sp. 6S3-12]|uniref:DsrE family protein n=1 Tax=Thiomicrorhabdus sp. 6S3-12 TaxID=2819681 RepID=UPI001AACE82C|nr:DsrE family protein [Thiomicrorhabdus sp. 6S3-12]MBO1924850.1 DsrE family protein [Thiomicrorhabdus sp. 6S3-12]
MKITNLALLTLFLGVTFALPNISVGDYAKRQDSHKVVYHINYDSYEKQTSALRNIQYHLDEVGVENIDLRVILDGDGLSMLLKPEALPRLHKFKAGNATLTMQQKIDQLKLNGVKFNICRNTVEGYHIDINNDLYDVDKKDIVPSGVAELAKLQSNGFVYLRP